MYQHGRNRSDGKTIPGKDRYVMVKPYLVTQRCDGQVVPDKNKDVMVKLYLAKIEM